MKTLAIVLVVSLALFAETMIVSPAEITCDSAAHAVSTAGIARWVLFVAPAANAAVVRVGDSNAGASRGIPIAAGGGYLLPVVSGFPGYDLTKIFYYCTSADKVNISWAK